jgi:hypothetical protein
MKAILILIIFGGLLACTLSIDKLKIENKQLKSRLDFALEHGCQRSKASPDWWHCPSPTPTHWLAFE